MLRDEYWRLLDLRRRSAEGPFDGELVALHLIEEVWPQTERYVLGRFETEGGKSWFRTGHQIFNVAETKRKYTVTWLRVPEDESRYSP